MKDLFLIINSTVIVYLGLSPENYDVYVFGVSGMPLLYLILFFLWGLKINELFNLFELGKVNDILRKIGNVLLSPLTFAFLKLSCFFGEFYSLRNGLVEIRRIYTPQEIKSELFKNYGFGEYVRNYPVTDKLVEVRYSRENFFCIFDEEYGKHLECLKEKLISERTEVSKKGFEFSELLSDFYSNHPYIIWGVGISAILLTFSVFVYLSSGSIDPNPNVTVPGNNLQQDPPDHFPFLLEKILENSKKIRDLSEKTIFTEGELVILQDFIQTLTPTSGQLLFKLLQEVERIDKDGKWPSHLYKAPENLMFDGVRKHWVEGPFIPGP